MGCQPAIMHGHAPLTSRVKLLLFKSASCDGMSTVARGIRVDGRMVIGCTLHQALRIVDTPEEGIVAWDESGFSLPTGRRIEITSGDCFTTIWWARCRTPWCKGKIPDDLPLEDRARGARWIHPPPWLLVPVSRTWDLVP